MPVEEVEQAHNLVRRVKTVRGELCFRMLCAPRFDYGRASHQVEQQEGTVLFSSEGNDRTALRLHTSVPLRIHNGDAIAEFTLRPDEHAEFVLEWVHPGKPRRRQHQTMCRAVSRTPPISGGAGLGTRPTRGAGGRWSTARP